MDANRKSQSLMVLTALGIVYGDIGTSPLYALRECFHGPHGIPLTETNILGVLSLMFWSLILVISLKYLQFILRADNRGEGGVLALTALACLQKDQFKKNFNWILLAMGIFGSALLVGDGMITPAISVLSAIEGLKVATPVFEPFILPITILILVSLFSIQKHGTAKIGGMFGPIMLLWFSTLGILGLISIIHTPQILFAISPTYAFSFVFNSPQLAFLVLGAIFLVVTGGEALYADMGHLGREAIARGWYFVALPGLLLNYFGQGALVLQRPELIENPFYHLAPSWGTYPLVVLSTMATIIASQAIISGLFSLARQSVQLGYFPRLEIVHTSNEEIGQIYVPAINWMTLLGTIWLVFEFKSSSSLAAAYGIAVSITMVITSILACSVAANLWKWKLRWVILLLVLFLIVDLSFVSANLMKIKDGGWVPLAIAAAVYILMTTWNKGRKELIANLKAQSYPLLTLLKELKEKPPARVPGCAVYMVGDTETTPPAFVSNLKHNKVLHDVVIFLTVVYEEVSHVPSSDRLNVKQISDGVFRIIARYGFSQTPNVSSILMKLDNDHPEFDCHNPTYFLGREIIASNESGVMKPWERKIFSFMAKNSRSADRYFQLPTESIIEVGMKVKI